MSELTGQNLRRFRSRDDDGGYRVANDGRSVTPRPIRRLNAPISQPFPVVAAPNDQDAGEHVDDLIVGYALGALEPDEQLAVERHAAYCPRCARLLAETRRTAAMLPFVAAPAAPSPDVKAALFTRIAQSSAPVSAEQADAFSWARPVTPQRSVTLPASGTWLESIPVVDAPAAVLAGKGRRPRRNLVRAAGISLPVLLTFGLLALFVVPQFLPSDDPENQQLVELLSSGPAECGSALAMATSPSISSACYFLHPARTSDGVSFWTINVSMQDSTPLTDYVVNVPLTDGTYQTLPNRIAIIQQQGETTFRKPENASTAQICLTEAGEVPAEVCPSLVAPAA